MRETIKISDVRAAAALGTARQRKILLALAAKERSLSQLSRLTDTPLNLLHHHVRKFLRLGLVTQTRVEPRAGAPIKHYRLRALLHQFVARSKPSARRYLIHAALARE